MNNYNTKYFSESDISYLLSESKKFKTGTPNHVPILIQIDSQVLVLNKNKYLVSNEIIFEDFLTTLKDKIENYHLTDTLGIYTVTTNPFTKQYLTDYKKSLKELYDTQKDISTEFLIIRINRLTSYKRLINFFFSK